MWVIYHLHCNINEQFCVLIETRTTVPHITELRNRTGTQFSGVSWVFISKRCLLLTTIKAQDYTHPSILTVLLRSSSKCIQLVEGYRQQTFLSYSCAAGGISNSGFTKIFRFNAIFFTMRSAFNVQL